MQQCKITKNFSTAFKKQDIFTIFYPHFNTFLANSIIFCVQNQQTIAYKSQRIIIFLCSPVNIHSTYKARNIIIPPMILHQWSIDSPSFLHRNDGLSMEYRWSILRGKAEKWRSLLHRKCRIPWMKNQ